MKDFRFQRGITGQDAPAEPLAVDRIGNTLYTDTFLAVIQQQAIASVVVAALPSDERVGSFTLSRHHPW